MAWDDEKVPHVDVVHAADWNALVAYVKTLGNGTLDGLVPTTEATASLIAEPNHVYVCNSAARVSVKLPETAAFGKVIEVIGKGSGGWEVTQWDGQYIRLNETFTTVGTGGSLASTARYDSITLRCTVADTTWTATAVIGNLQVI